MASQQGKIIFRIFLLILLFLVIFYVGRPLYWKISATVSDIRHNKQTVKQGLSQIVLEAQKTMRWYSNDESDSGIQSGRVGSSVSRRLMMTFRIGRGLN